MTNHADHHLELVTYDRDGRHPNESTSEVHTVREILEALANHEGPDGKPVLTRRTITSPTTRERVVYYVSQWHPVEFTTGDFPPETAPPVELANEHHEDLAARLAPLFGLSLEDARRAVWAWERGEYGPMRGLATGQDNSYDYVSGKVDALLGVQAHYEDELDAPDDDEGDQE